MNGIASRIAAASLVVALAVAAILTLGVFAFSAVAFERLMVEHGSTVTAAHEMFDETITRFFAGSLAVAAGASIALSVALARRISRPLRAIGAAARLVAAGDYSVRVARTGPEEIVSLADSFNQMAVEIGEQERIRQEFIANAAHELRTPLTNLQGYLEALRDEVIAPDRPTFVSLHEEVERLVRLAHSLDSLAAGDLATTPPTLVDLDLASAIRSAVELVRPSFDRRSIAIAVDVPGGLRARAQPDHLAQVLANLLQNAVRYTPATGTVTVAAARRPADIVVSVTNTGAIPTAALPHLFERFYRVEKSRDQALGGVGIGLAIVKRLVELGGGQVGAESGADRTRFWFSLPA